MSEYSGCYQPHTDFHSLAITAHPANSCSSAQWPLKQCVLYVCVLMGAGFHRARLIAASFFWMPAYLEFVFQMLACKNTKIQMLACICIFVTHIDGCWRQKVARMHRIPSLGIS